MKGTLAIAQRELIEKRFVLFAAAAFLVVVLIVPFVPGIHAGERVAAMSFASLGVAAVFTIALAAILGSSIVGRELTEGRLSFYFSKPVAASSIWWGKLIASAVLMVTSFVIIALPTFFWAPTLHEWIHAPSGAFEAIEALLGIAAALFLLTHVISTFVRSRSRWIVVDFVALILCGVAIWMLARPLSEGSAIELMRRLANAFAGFTAMAIAGAGAWQLARGRTDRKRSHVELSRFLWLMIACGLVVVSGYVMWVVSATPADISVPYLAQQSNGSWAFVGGQTRNRVDYRAAFLYNVDTGRFVRIPQPQPSWEILFSPDSKAAFWVIQSQGVIDFWMARLDVPSPHPAQTPITLRRSRAFNVSQNGSRLAAIDSAGVLSVYDVRSGDLQASARVPAGTSWWAYFDDPNLVRIYAFTNPKTPPGIFAFDVAKKAFTKTGEMAWVSPRFNRDRTRMLDLSGGIVIRDAHSGSLLQTLPGSFRTAKFLSDGRIVSIDRNGRILTIFSSEGVETHSIALPAMQVDTIYEPSSGLLAACSSRDGCVTIDAQRGAVLRVDRTIRPMTYATTAARVLCLSGDRLVIWNPATGEKRPLS